MESLNLYFKDLRHSRNLSLEQIWEDLRLPAEKITAIESGHWEALGEYGIRKAMLYNYARYLEADIYAVMTEFDQLFPPSSQSGPNVILVPKEKKILLSTNFIWMVAILLIVIILGSIVFAAYRNGFLESPKLFSKQEADTLRAIQPIKEEAEPAIADSTRTRMLALTQMLQPSPEEEKQKDEVHKAEIISDNTDYMGKFLGKNPMNVQIH